MGVVSVNRLFRNEQCSQDTELNYDEIVTYMVTLDEKGSCAAALQAAGVPIRGDGHPDNDNLDTQLYAKTRTCRRIAESPKQGQYHFEVEVHYDDVLPEQIEDDPFEVTYNVTCMPYEFQTNLAYGNGDTPPAEGDDPVAVTNSAKDPIKPWQSITRYDERIQIGFKTRNSIVISNVDDLTGYVNSDTVTIDELGWTFEPGDLLWTDVNIQTSDVEDVYVCSFSLIYRDGGWIRKLVDEGLYHKKEGDTTQKSLRTLDSNYQERVIEGYLDGNGKKLPSGEKVKFVQYWFNYGEEFQHVLNSVINHS